MCGIAGLVSDTERDLGPLLGEMLHTMYHRGPDGAGYVIGEACERELELENLDFKGKVGHVALGHVRLAITGGLSGTQPFQSASGRLSLLHNGEIYNYRQLMGDVPDDAELSTGSDSEVLTRLLEDAYEGNLADAVEEVLPMLDGVYAIAVTDQTQTVIARDRIGIRQLYYLTHGGLTAFASEKKSLQALGIESAKIHRVLPGEMLIINWNELTQKKFWTPDRIERTGAIETMQDAMKIYDGALKRATRKRLAGRDRVGILYSGGIDSVLVAYLVQQSGVPFTCYTAGTASGSTDVDWARRTAEKFGFPLEIITLTPEEIERLLPEVINTIEDQSLNQVEVAIPMYAAIRRAQEAGERVVLTGQGVDEIFGGYSWYAKMVDRHGYDRFSEQSWEDTFLLYKECLEREDKIAMAHSIELRVPFLDPEVIEAAFAIAPELKIERGGDDLRKRIHRAYCRHIGIPEGIAFRTKEAAQHGANVHDIFEEIAEQNGITPATVERTDYDPEKTVNEKLGSSSRYGYRYGERHLWKPQAHVQLYLDMLARRLGMLPRVPLYHVECALSQLTTVGAAI
jgi:asparagine synthase (glutamine-hydrolysing)